MRSKGHGGVSKALRTEVMSTIERERRVEFNDGMDELPSISARSRRRKLPSGLKTKKA